MTDKVIALDDHRPHTATYVACMACAADWVAVSPVSAKVPLECPKCGAMEGEAVQPHSLDWFNRFMAGKDQKRRTMVLLNANRMEAGQ